MNWVAAAGYAAAGIPCLARGLQRGEAAWAGAAGVLFLLGSVQAAQLDLLVTGALRSLAWHEGWYGMRRPLQAIVLAAGAGALVAAARRLGSQPLLALGTGICLFLGWARVVSLHHVDEILNAGVFGLRAGRWLDAVGLLLVVAACVWPGERRA